MFFLSAEIPFLEPLVNTLLAFLESVPVGIVVMAFFIAWVGCWLPVAGVLAIALKWELNKPLQPEQKIPIMVSLYLLAPLILWGVSWIRHKSFSDYGFVSQISFFSSLLLGFGLGVLSLTIVFTGQLWLGWCSLENSHIQQIPSILLPITFIALFVGGIEELVFRGFLFTELKTDYPVWAAAVISSLIFALLHLIWERSETLPQLPGLWLLGIVLVLARLADHGNIGIAWGLHSGWIWAIATIDTAQLITYTGKVSEWLTGKNKKPLAGLGGIVCVLGVGLILWLFTQ